MDINQSLCNIEQQPEPSVYLQTLPPPSASGKTISAKYSSPSLPALMSLFLCFSNQYSGRNWAGSNYSSPAWGVAAAGGA